jgi:hypothetical protein
VASLPLPFVQYQQRVAEAADGYFIRNGRALKAGLTGGGRQQTRGQGEADDRLKRGNEQRCSSFLQLK